MERFQKHSEINAIGVASIDVWTFMLWVYVNKFNVSKLRYIVAIGQNV